MATHRVALLGVLALGLALRLCVAWIGDFTVHPDEVMQVLEPAHRVVFGPGIVPWEWDVGMRSWLLPGFVAGLFQLCAALGFDRPEAYLSVVEGVLCLVSTSGALAMALYAEARWGPWAGLVAGACGALWWELVMLAPRPLLEQVGGVALLWAMALSVRARGAGRTAACGALCALGVMMRPQYAPAGLVIAAFAWPRLPRPRFALGAGLAVVLAVGALDWLTLGAPFHSYLANLQYNIGAGLAAAQGVEGPAFYPLRLTQASLGLAPLVVALSLTRWRSLAEPLCLFAAVLVPHLFIDHKEYRYVWLAGPAWLLLASGLSAAWLREGTRAARRGAGVLWSALGLVAAAGIAFVLPAQSDIYLVFGRRVQGLFEARDDLTAYHYLASRGDVTGVVDLATQAWTNTGGYSHLHHAVPLYQGATLAELERGPITADVLARYASHLILKADMPRPTGFVPLARFGELTVWHAEPPRQQFVWTNYTPHLSRKRLQERFTLQPILDSPQP